MNLFRTVLAGALLLGLAFGAVPSAAQEKEKNTRDKLVGVWELTRGETLPPGASLEFARDGKLKLTVKGPDEKPITLEGTFEANGNQLKVTTKGPDGKDQTEAMKIRTLTDKELVLLDDKGKADAFKRKK
jgi:uncharacterized protein (TIGR03066 family)